MAAAETKKFLLRHPEKEDLNQYWYSEATISTMANEVIQQQMAVEQEGFCAAFLSTPSIYFALKPEQRKGSILLDFDEKFGKDDGFVQYDFHHPEEIPKKYHQTFSMVIIDPPFITREVWEKYTEAVKLLLKPNGKILLSTISENEAMMKELLQANPQQFRPSIPNLVYQYSLYCNYESKSLSILNPEIDDC